MDNYDQFTVIMNSRYQVQQILLIINCFLQLEVKIEEKMSNTLKFSIKDHQFADKCKRQSERSNQMNLLNLSQINRNAEKHNALNSDRTLSYRYQKINNSFRLVQVDGGSVENKENVNEPNRRLSDGKNTRILQSINELCQRVERLQKNQKFQDQKQSFNLHKMIEKAVAQSLDLKNSKYCLERQKNIQTAMMEVQQLKQKIHSISIAPAYVNEMQVLRKCKNMIEEEILGEKMDRVKSMRQQIEKLHGIVGRQSQSIYNNQSTQHIRIIDTLMVHMNQKLECSLKNIQMHLQNKQSELFRQVDRLKINQNLCFKMCEQVQLKTGKDRILSNSHPNQTGNAKIVRQRCLKGVVASLVIQIGLKTLSSNLVSKRQHGTQEILKMQSLLYQIDPQGLLVDSEGFYLQDEQGSTIKISDDHIKKLVQLGIFNK